MAAIPKVSVGLPVYNGENFLSDAIESILNQTFRDFELIISDNASTDQTEEICRTFAAQDDRIRYLRADTNNGASWNHEQVIQLARAPLFKLAAHDDVCLPEHLAVCVKALEQNPDAVLAHTQTWMMRGRSAQATLYQDEVETDSNVAAIRFGDLIHEAPPAFPIFGVVRRDALLSIPRFDPYKASDRVVLTRLALLGRFVEVKEPLFKYRWHEHNASNLMNTRSGFYQWWHPDRGQGRVYPELRIAWEHLKSPFIAPLSWPDRKAVLREWWHWLLQRRAHLKADLAQIWGGTGDALPPRDPFEKAFQRRSRALYKQAYYADQQPNKASDP